MRVTASSVQCDQFHHVSGREQVVFMTCSIAESFLVSKLFSESTMYYRERRGSCRGRGGGDCPFQGVSFCQSTVRKFKKNRGHISLGSAYCRTFLGRFFPPNALRPDLYLLLVITCAETIRTFSFMYIPPTTWLCVFLEYNPCECTFFLKNIIYKNE